MLQKPQWKEIILAVLMAILTVIFCLVIADGILGTDGHADGSTWYVKDNRGLIFFWISMTVITSVFAFFVDWKHTWIVIPVYILLYIPVGAYFGESPHHTYLDKTTFAMLTLGPDLSLLRPLITAIRFWLIQSQIYLVIWPIKAFIKWVRKEQTV